MRGSDDNSFSEPLFRTMKNRPDYLDGPFAIEQDVTLASSSRSRVRRSQAARNP